MKKIFALTLVGAFLIGAAWYFHRTRHQDAFNITQALEVDRVIPIAVIGSGPAGLSAALYGARAALYTVVFEGSKPGGQLVDTTYVENWPGTPRLLGSELIELNRKQAQRYGAVMVADGIEYVDFNTWPFRLKTEQGQEVHALTVIIASGSTPRLLGVPGEKEYFGAGVTTCAKCDAPFFKDKQVVVVGGGDSAIEEATLLASYAKQVTMLVRSDTLRAAPAMQERIKGIDNITVAYHASIGQIIGDGSIVKEIELIDNRDKSTKKIPMDGIFLAIGHEPNSDVFKGYITTDAAGYILHEPFTQKTNKAGIFVAGDVSDPRYRQAGTAAGDGIKAALDAIYFLQDLGFNDAFAKKLQRSYYDPAPDAQKDVPEIKTLAAFKAAVKKSPLLLVDVGAESCSACQIMLPFVKSIAAQFEGKIDVISIDYDHADQALKDAIKAVGLPTVIIYKAGEPLTRFDKKAFSKFELVQMVRHVTQEE